MTDQPTCIICRWRDLNPGRAQVCVPCETRLGRQLTMLAAAVPWLAAIASNEPTPAGHYDLNAAGLTWPAHLTTTLGPDDDQIGVPPIATTLGWWADTWALTTDRQPAAHYIRQLANHLPDRCAWDTQITVFAADLADLVATTRRAMHRDLRATRYAAPCPHCGERRLRKGCGEEEIRCGACEAVWDDHDYTIAAIKALPDEALLYAHEVATMLGINNKTVEQWCWRGRMAPDAWDGKPKTSDPQDQGRPLYSAGQARRVAHEVMLYREWKAELVIRRELAYPQSLIVPAFTCVEIAGLFDITVGRGAIVTIGPLTEAQADLLIEQAIEANKPRRTRPEQVAEDPKVTVG